MNVIVNYAGRLGNNMFQYAFGKTIAETLGRDLIAIPGKFEHQDSFPNIAHDYSGKRNIPNEILFDETRDYNISKNQIYLAPHNKDIVLNGYWQRWQFYRANIYEIKLWFHLPEWTEEKPNKHDIILHFRRDDYMESGSELPFEYYHHILSRTRYGKVYITGDIDDSVKKDFAKYNPQYVTLNPIDTLRFVKCFNNIIMSNSTFIWWGAFLSNARNVWCPLPSKGYWSKSQNQDLFIPGLWTQVAIT